MKSQSADMVFVRCELQSATPGYAEAPAAGRRQVVVNGKRVKTVDVHAHTAVPAANALVGRTLEANALLKEDLPTRLRAMDAQGIDVEALSINPFWYKADRDVAAKLIEIQNQALAEFCASHPDRFVAFATVALQHPDLAVQQLVDGVKKYGFRGAGVAGSVDGKELADPTFNPFWAKAEEMGVLIFMHPLGTAELEASGRLDGNGLLWLHAGHVLVRGARVPIIEGPNLEHTRLDLTGVPDARVGDEVVIIGRQGTEEITIADVAKRAGIGLHHVATTVGPRVARVYRREP